MTVLRSGASKKYSDNWNAAFGSAKKKVAKAKTNSTSVRGKVSGNKSGRTTAKAGKN